MITVSPHRFDGIFSENDKYGEDINLSKVYSVYSVPEIWALTSNCVYKQDILQTGHAHIP